jgi:hypothetical protein
MAKKYLFELNVDTINAAHVVNPQEFFSKALLSERSTSLFRPFLNVNSKIKLGSLEFDDILQEADCDFAATDSNLTAKEMEPCKLGLGVEICQYDLQNSFVAEYMKRGNTIDFANTAGLTPEFLAHYYERLGAKLNDNLERLTWQGDTTLTGTTYLNLCDGLEAKLGADTGVTLTVTAATVDVSTVIAEITKVYNLIPAELDRSEVAIMASSDIIRAFKVAVSTAAAENFVTRNPELVFIDVKLVEAKGMSAGKMVASRLSNFIFLTDLVSPASELITINMKATTGDRKLRTISDFTFGVDYVNPEEFVTYGL